MQKVNWKLDKQEAHRQEKRKRTEISYTWQTRKKENLQETKQFHVITNHQSSALTNIKLLVSEKFIDLFHNTPLAEVSLMPPFGENHPKHLWHLQSMSCPFVSRENRLYFQVESPSIHEDVIVISNTEDSHNDGRDGREFLINHVSHIVHGKPNTHQNEGIICFWFCYWMTQIYNYIFTSQRYKCALPASYEWKGLHATAIYSPQMVSTVGHCLVAWHQVNPKRKG